MCIHGLGFCGKGSMQQSVSQVWLCSDVVESSYFDPWISTLLHQLWCLQGSLDHLVVVLQNSLANLSVFMHPGKARSSSVLLRSVVNCA